MKKILKLFMFSIFTFIIILISSCSNKYILIGYESNNHSSKISNPYNETGTRIKANSSASETQDIEISYGFIREFADPLIGKNNIYTESNQEIKFELLRCIDDNYKDTDFLSQTVVYSFNDTLIHFFDEFYIDNNDTFVDTITKDDLIITENETYIYYYYRLTPINEENILLFNVHIHDGSTVTYSPLDASKNGPSEYRSQNNVKIFYKLDNGKIQLYK
jgi:hypothetical protein